MYNHHIFQTVDGDLSEINLKYFYLVDKLISLLSVVEKLPFDLLNACCGLKACESIPLFPANFLLKLSKCESAFHFKVLLLPFITWVHHSILNELVAASDNAVAKHLLDQFESKFDKKKSVTSYPIPAPSQLMIPLKNSEYTILAVKLYNCNDITLHKVEEIKLLMTRCLKVTSHVFQLIAIHIKLSYLYWMIPRHVVSFIQSNMKFNHEVWQNAFTMFILPDGLFGDKSVYSVQEKLKGPFSLFYTQLDDDSTDHEVCMYILRLMIATHKAKKKQALHDKRIS